MPSTYDWEDRKAFGDKAVELVKQAEDLTRMDQLVNNAIAFDQASILVGIANVYALLARAD